MLEAILRRFESRVGLLREKQRLQEPSPSVYLEVSKRGRPETRLCGVAWYRVGGCRLSAARVARWSVWEACGQKKEKEAI